MESQLTEQYSKYSLSRDKPWSPATLKTYVKNICNLHCMCHPTKEFKNLLFLRDTEKVLGSLESKGTQTKRNYINSALIALTVNIFHSPSSPSIKWINPLIKHYENVRDVLYHEYMMEKESNKGKTSHQTDVFSKVKKEDIDKLCNTEVDTNDYEEYQANMILNFYKSFPLRNELADVKCIYIREYNKSQKHNDKENFLVIRRGGNHFTLIFNTYKTSSKLGRKTIDITDKRLSNLIYKWLSEVRKIPLNQINYKPLLCCKGSDKCLTRNDMSMKLRAYTNKHLGSNISSTLMAKYYSPEIKDMSNPTAEEIKKVVTFADQRGHSISTHLTHYNQS